MILIGISFSIKKIILALININSNWYNNNTFTQQTLVISTLVIHIDMKLYIILIRLKSR